MLWIILVHDHSFDPEVYKILGSMTMQSVTVNKNRYDRDEEQAKRLVGQFRNGDDQALNKLIMMYRSQVTALALKMVNDYDEASDIAQDVFVKVAANIWRYDTKKRFYTWLYRITVNAGIDYIRKHKRHRHEQLEDHLDYTDRYDVSPEYNYRRRQLTSYIDQAADALNEKQRSAFLLRDVNGCKIDEVASIMDMPEATVRWYLHRARTRLRRELSRRCPQLLLQFGVE